MPIIKDKIASQIAGNREARCKLRIDLEKSKIFIGRTRRASFWVSDLEKSVGNGKVVAGLNNS